MEKLSQHLVHEQEAEKARKKRIELEEKRSIGKQQRKATATKDAFEKLEELLESEQRARHAVLMEKAVKATEEREEYKTLLKQAIGRQHRMQEGLGTGHTTAQVHTIPSPSRRSLWFQHPGYELLDWLAWLLWAPMVLFDIYWSVDVTIVPMDLDFPVWSFLVAYLIGWNVLSSKTFLTSHDPESFGCILLLFNFTFRTALGVRLEPDKEYRFLLYLQSLGTAIMGIRYIIGS
jgi:hypothetical protein